MASNSHVKIGIIGGSGLDDPDILEGRTERYVVTPFGKVLMEVAQGLGVKCHTRGTMVTIEGPRFSSRAESLMFRQWGADVINMTTVPEVVLAKEAGLCYASIAMATDYDCWKEHEEAVSR
ncbi:S-methyl-5 -thioadenosine phosphorylase [Labeo rohita]|uniref:S-methyl-5-thioadenosine phosphorylase n=1 Tax=Labeo rohita TaxID=84645 RepID=A0A498NAK1_LABRO|nr:S-methyl-5 -thioadenosine phosphorylase [Labeo rohita]